jgi:peptide-methionine (S)-S-oxide reductase
MKMKNSLIISKRFDNVATEIRPAQAFYPAEDYHQNYADKNPERYAAYRTGCARDARLQEVWGK